jgi:CHAD domain-containing protein
MMELCLPFAGGEFKTAYNRLKDVASLLGKIHDLDDAANILRKNKNIPGTGKIVRFVRARRKILYLKFKKAQRKFEKPGVEDLIKN